MADMDLEKLYDYCLKSYRDVARKADICRTIGTYKQYNIWGKQILIATFKAKLITHYNTTI